MDGEKESMERAASGSLNSWHPAHKPNGLQASRSTLSPDVRISSFHSTSDQAPQVPKMNFDASSNPHMSKDGLAVLMATAVPLTHAAWDEISSDEEVEAADPVSNVSTGPQEFRDREAEMLNMPGSDLDSISDSPNPQVGLAGQEPRFATAVKSPFDGITTLDRSTSFPDVPIGPSLRPPSESLPHSQVEKIIEDEDLDGSLMEDEGVFFPQYAQEEETPDQRQDPGTDIFSQNHHEVSENSKPPSNEESRFEEGLPLLSSNANAPKPSFREDSSFDQQVVEQIQAPQAGNDFLAQSPNNGHERDTHLGPRKLDRKTTGDVLGAMTFVSNDGINAEPDFADLLNSNTLAAETISEGAGENNHTSEKAEELDAVWQAALDDDDLLDESTSINPSSFFGDDAPKDDVRSTKMENPSRLSNQYASPSSLPSQDDQSSARYQPKAPTLMPQQNVPNSLSQPFIGQGDISVAPPLQPAQVNGLMPPRPQMPQPTQSFADKSKGGYTSPYDLPMDVSRPAKKRNFTQNNRLTTGSTSTTGPRAPPPPRSSSMYANASPTLQSPPPLPASQAPLPVQAQPRAAVKPQSSGFFEELPSTTLRPASRRSIPSHQQAPSPGVSVSPSAAGSQQAVYRPTSSSSDEAQAFGLMPPSRIGPYATAANHTPAPPAVGPMSSRYSPAPVPQHGVLPPRTRYAASPSNVPKGPPPPIIPFQPRTSSPLAHKAPAIQSEPQAPSRQSPPRRQMSIPAANVSSPPPNSAQDSRYEPLAGQRPLPSQQAPHIYGETNTATNHLYRPLPEVPLQYNNQEVSTHDMEPKSRSHPSDMRSPPLENNFLPPPRSMTQSPGAVRPRSSLAALSQESLQRPASVNARPFHSQRATYSLGVNPNLSPSAPQKPFAQTILDSVDFVKPNNDLQHDTLERWKGSPVFYFGFGGTVVSSLPLRIPRYSAGLMTPSIICTAGDIRIRDQKDILPEELVGSFPGPLKSRGKKKDLLEWLQKKIAQLQSQYEADSLNSAVPDYRKRCEDKVSLWQLVRVLVEYDGVIEGKPAAENAARLILSPELSRNEGEVGANFRSPPPNISRVSGAPPLSEPADPGALESFRKLLLQGEREKAVYFALDRRLWAHAMLISSTMEKAVWKQVLQEFVRQEVKTSGENTESLAALYQIFAGNWEESVDELVPPSARAGMQLVSKMTGPGPTKNALDGLDRWRETVTLALGNPVPGNGEAMAALGRLLASYGRVEASHICYLFAKNPSLFGAPEDPNVAISLLGADHQEQPYDISRDTDNILLTEVFDFANHVLHSGPITSSLHMQPHKLYHAYVLADNGYKAEAQAYCDDLASFIKSSPKAQAPYLSQIVGPLDELSSRLRQAPTSSSGSWMPKPTMDKVSGSLMSRFTSFVAGEDSDADSTGSGRGQAPDPFAKVAGDTPGVSPSPSSGDLFGTHSSGGTYVPTQPPLTGAGSRYAPPGVVTPRSSLDQGGRLSQESPRALPNDARKTSMYQQSSTSRYAAPAFSDEIAHEPKEGTYQPSPYQPQPNASASYLPTPPLQPDQTFPVTHAPYAPVLNQQASSAYTLQVASQPFQTSPSSGDLFGTHSSGGTYVPTQPPLTGAGSRYAPPGVVTPRSSLDQGGRLSQESPRALPNDARKTSMYQQSSTSRYAAPAFSDEIAHEPKEGTYQPSPYQPQPNASASYLPTPPLQPDQTFPVTHAPYAPVLNQQASSAYTLQVASQPFQTSQGNPSESVEPIASHDEPSVDGYEPPSSSYAPYSPPALTSPPTSPRKKKSFMDLSDDEDTSVRNAPATNKANNAAAKAQRDRDADAAFRAAAEADAKKDQSLQPKKSGWLGGWFGGKKGDDLGGSGSGGGGGQSGTPGAPIKAKLGEESSFYYDKELKKWVNKKAGPDAAKAAAPTPPPPRGGPPPGSRAVSGVAGPPPRSSTDTPPVPPLPAGTPPVNITSAPSSTAPPAAPFFNPSNPASRSESPVIGSGGESAAPPLLAASSLMPGGNGPPSRPGTAVSNASSIDDLLAGPAGGSRAGGTMRKKKRGYVDVMAK